MEVFRVVSDHITKGTILEVAQIIVCLVLLMSFLKINGNLCCDFGKNTCIHTSIASFLKEKVLSLSEAKIAIHGQGFFIEVSSCIRWRQLGNL